MNIFVTIYGVTSETTTDAALGLYEGKLCWSSVATSYNGVPYKAGIIDKSSFSGLTQSITNIASGGTFAAAYSDIIQVAYLSAAVRSAIDNHTIQLNGRSCLLQLQLGSEITTLLSYPITAVSPVDEIGGTIYIDTESYLDQRKLSSAVITAEMALNNDESDIVGKTITESFGGYALYKLFYCEAKRSTMGLSAGWGDDGIGVNAPVLGKDTKVAQIAVQDFSQYYSFMKGKSLLQCIGRWQASTTDSVWIALSYNGKDLLFGNPFFTETILRKTFASKHLAAVLGTGSDKTYRILDVAITTHPTPWHTTDITSVWFCLDTTNIDDFRESLPYKEGAPDGNSELILFAVNNNLGIVSNVLMPNEGGNLRNSVTYLSLLTECTGLFLTHASANLTDCQLLVKDDSLMGYSVVASPENIQQVYHTDKWQLLALSFNERYGETFGELTQSAPIEALSYLCENPSSLGYWRYINCVIAYDYMAWQLTTVIQDSHPYTEELIPIPAYPTMTFTNTGSTDRTDYVAVNTFHVPTTSEMLQDGVAVSALPDIQLDLLIPSDKAYYLDCFIDIYVIAEGGIALLKKSSKVTTRVASGLSTTHIHLDPHSGTLTLPATADVGQASKALYSILERATLISPDELPTDLRTITGLLLVSHIHWRLADLSKFSLQHFNKTIRPCVVRRIKAVAKKDLYLRCQKSTDITTPVELASQLVTSVGIPQDSESVASVAQLERAFMSYGDSAFDGAYSPTGDESTTTIVDNIAKGALFLAYLDEVGTFHAKALHAVPSTVSFTFSNTNIKDKTVSLSMPKNGYRYSDFDFSVPLTPLGRATTATVDTDAITPFPDSSLYPIGQILFNHANGYDITRPPALGAFEELINADCLQLKVYGHNSELFCTFIPGTVWRFRGEIWGKLYTLIVRCDTVAPLATDPGLEAIALLFKIQSKTWVAGTIEDELCLYGPEATWRSYVTGPLVRDYTLAKAMWDDAYEARSLLGSEQKAPTSSTQMDQPIWGTDRMAVTSWMAATVRYLSREKLVIRFVSPLIVGVARVRKADYVRFQFGPFKDNGIDGYVCEKAIDLDKGTVTFTLLCVIDYNAVLAVLAESGVDVNLETNGYVQIENGADGLKISEMGVATTEQALAAAAVLPVAMLNGGLLENRKVSFSDLVANISDAVLDSQLQLGESATTAYRGDHGKVAYNHSQVTGNPHGTTIGSITGLDVALEAKFYGTVSNSRIPQGDSTGTNKLKDTSWQTYFDGLQPVEDNKSDLGARSKRIKSFFAYTVNAVTEVIEAGLTLASKYSPFSHAVNDTRHGIASSTLYGHTKCSTTLPLMDGIADAGTDGALFSAYNHRHPSDTTKLSNNRYTWTRGSITNAPGWATIISVTLPNSTTTSYQWIFNVYRMGSSADRSPRVGILNIGWRNGALTASFVQLSGSYNESKFGYTGTLAPNTIFEVYGYCSAYPYLTLEPVEVVAGVVEGGAFSATDPSMVDIDVISTANFEAVHSRVDAGSQDDWDTLVTPGTYRIVGTIGANGPTGAYGYGILEVLARSLTTTVRCVQLYMPFRNPGASNGGMWMRVAYDGVFYGWQNIVDKAYNDTIYALVGGSPSFNDLTANTLSAGRIYSDGTCTFGSTAIQNKCDMRADVYMGTSVSTANADGTISPYVTGFINRATFTAARNWKLPYPHQNKMLFVSNDGASTTYDLILNPPSGVTIQYGISSLALKGGNNGGLKGVLLCGTSDTHWSIISTYVL